MRFSFLTLTLLLITACRVDGHYVSPDADGDAGPSGSWLKHIHSSGAEEVDGIVLGPGGSVVIAGSFDQTIDLGGGPLTAASRNNLFVAKFGPNGQHVWSRSFSGGFSSVARLKLLSNGDVVVAGDFYGSVTFGSTTLSSVGDQDVFIARISSLGDPIWARSGGSSSRDSIKDISVDPDDNIAACGELNGGGSFFGSPTLSGARVWLVRLTSTGNHSWSRAMSAGGVDYECGVASMSDGDVIFVANFNGAVSAGGLTFTSTAGTFDIYMVRFFATDGSHLWSAAKGGSGTDVAEDVEVSDSSIIVTGWFTNSISFGGSTLTAQGPDAFVAKFDASNGSHQFSTSMGDNGRRLAIRSDGQVTASGIFSGTTDFGGTPLTSTDLNTPDPFVVDLDGTSGAVLSVRSVGGAQINDVATSLGSLAVVGSFDSSITVLNQKLTGEGLVDGYVILFKR